MKTTFSEALTFDCWNSFLNSLETAIKEGVSSEKELVEKSSLDYELYTKVKHNMVHNWIDSTSKSLLLALQYQKNVPVEGEQIFKTPKDQTRFVVICGPGYRQSSMFLGGSDNRTEGLHLFGYPSIKASDGKGFNLNNLKDNVHLTVNDEKKTLINDILRCIWVYIQFQKNLLTDKKLPKVLYRGIRFNNLFGKPALKDKWAEICKNGTRYKKYVDMCNFITEYISKNGINDLMDGDFLSFTASESIAKDFTRGEGIVIKVTPTKENIITSELTEELFAVPNNVTGKKEREYILDVTNYKFQPEDIEIIALDYFIGTNSPLGVAQFHHDNLEAQYVLNGKKITAGYYWSSNDRGGILYHSKDTKSGLPISRKKFKEEIGFDPMPTKENLAQISDFKYFNKERYSMKRKLIVE